MIQGHKFYINKYPKKEGFGYRLQFTKQIDLKLFKWEKTFVTKQAAEEFAVKNHEKFLEDRAKSRKDNPTKKNTRGITHSQSLNGRLGELETMLMNLLTKIDIILERGK